MILPIRLYTDPILHHPCHAVKVFDEQLSRLAEDMFETMRANSGIGLAANQVGIDKRICVMSLEGGTKPLVFVNPVLLGCKKPREVAIEGCLSAPGMRIHIKRYDTITIGCQTLTGEQMHYEVTGMDARIVQHELAHLEGFTIVDGLLKLTR